MQHIAQKIERLRVPGRINKIGLEVEGGWDVRRRVKYDGSVTVRDGAVTGEMVSRPIVRQSTIVKWVQQNWPQHTNNSCGFHIHFSFKNQADYAALMDEKFLKFFCDYMEEFGRRWGVKNEQFAARLAGNNSYCRKVWTARTQARAVSKVTDRYALWNFCWRLHGTAECRAYPAFKEANTALCVLQATLDCVELWCSKKALLAIEDEVEQPEVTPLVSHEEEDACE